MSSVYKEMKVAARDTASRRQERSLSSANQEVAAYMFPILVLLLVSSVSAQASKLPFSSETDKDALLAFKVSLSRHSAAVASWNTSVDLCQWQGVLCSVRHKNRVSALDLSSEGLVGTITHSIGNLTFLRSLNLSSNALHGEIPSTIGRLHRLKFLNLSSNSLQGEITTDLRNCTSLASIYLDTNRFTGEMPTWLGSLSKLEAIRLYGNNFTGIIPSSLGNLSSLQKIDLFRNHLEGTIPASLGRLSSLEFVDLGENNLSGTIPKTLFNISSLIDLTVAINELHGTLPSGLGNSLPKLQYLLLSNNHFTGSVPASLVNATMIYWLELAVNNFTGIVPSVIGKLCPNFISLAANQFEASSVQDWKFVTFLTNCTRLRVIDLQNNMLGGALPSSISNLSVQLQVLALTRNEISGNIPIHINNLAGLQMVLLARNRFSGVLPDSIGSLKMLKRLHLHINLLAGTIPPSLGNLTQLQILYMHDNSFEGTLPASLENLQQLTSATFSNNMFSGPLPREIFNISSLSYDLDLSSNRFIGPLPPEVGRLTKITYFYIYENNLSGPLPDTLSNCQSLMFLRLDHNSFDGSIPVSISKLKGLVVLNLTENLISGTIPHELGLMGGLNALYLAHNKLYGQIPETLENMTSLYWLDISFNHLDGPVPMHGVFANVTRFSFARNDRLCGGVWELHLPECPTEVVDHRQRKHQVILRVIIPIASIMLCFVLAFLFFYLRRKMRARSTTRAIGVPLMNDKYPRVSYSDLVQGTNGFAATNLIGAGRYGFVYKGSLWIKNTETIVAIKVFDLKQSGSSRSFVAECEALSKIRHRNLISVITCCSSSDWEQNDFKALVFEFMPNGSLNNWLHLDEHALRQVQGLTLVQRLNIVVDVADAVDYLHNNCQPQIVHCDLKPSNILLGDDMVAHVGDFGLAKILSGSSGEQLINSKSSIGIRGTIGYVAPEYGEGGQVSTCGDIYSFGIVLLETFTGKAPTDALFNDGLTLQKHVEMAFPERLMEIVDPILLAIEETSATNLQDRSNAWGEINTVMISITRLAILCSQQMPTERMCMRDAAAEIRRIRARYATQVTTASSLKL